MPTPAPRDRSRWVPALRIACLQRCGSGSGWPRGRCLASTLFLLINFRALRFRGEKLSFVLLIYQHMYINGPWWWQEWQSKLLEMAKSEVNLLYMSILLFTAHLSIPWWRQPRPPRRRRWGCTGRCTGSFASPSWQECWNFFGFA